MTHPVIPRILVVDDEVDLRELVELTLVRMGFSVDTAGTIAEAKQCLERERHQLVLTDMRLKDGTGFEVLQHSLICQPGTPVAVITAYGSTEQAVHALKSGAFDYLTKPLEIDRLRSLVRTALDNSASADPRRGTPSSELIGSSQAIEAVRAMIVRLARSMAPVLIHGESGSGKERAARLIHLNSSRAAQPFIAVNCGAIPENLMESEFFGYRKGAFTGADQDREGFFQAAQGGTLLLDEVAELPLSMQVKLLRVIQERRVRKVGATQEEGVDVRILSATHRSLSDGVSRGVFRQDLYYRLNVIELTLPPLRDRPDDIPALAQAFLHKHAPSADGANNGSRFNLTPAALQALRSYDYPGNVRELENILERALALSNGPDLGPELMHLPQTSPYSVVRSSTTVHPPEFAPPSPERESLKSNSDHVEKSHTDALSLATSNFSPSQAAADSLRQAIDALALPLSLNEQLAEIERQLLRRALEQAGNRLEAASLLGITPRQLRYRLQLLNPLAADPTEPSI